MYHTGICVEYKVANSTFKTALEFHKNPPLLTMHVTGVTQQSRKQDYLILILLT